MLICSAKLVAKMAQNNLGVWVGKVQKVKQWLAIHFFIIKKKQIVMSAHLREAGGL